MADDRYGKDMRRIDRYFHFRGIRILSWRLKLSFNFLNLLTAQTRRLIPREQVPDDAQTNPDAEAVA